MNGAGYARVNELSDVVYGATVRSPLTLLLPHSGARYDDVLHHLDLNREEVRRTLMTGVDHSVPEVTKALEFEGASVFGTNLARAVLDVNRGRNDVDRHSVVDGGDEPKSQGLIWNATTMAKPEDIVEMLTHPYTRKEFEELIRIGYSPLDNAVRESMARSREQYPVAVLFDIHSIWANETATVQPGDPQSEQHLGAYLLGGPLDPPSLDGTPNLYLMTSKDPVTGENISCCPELRQYIMNHFRDHGLQVKERQVASTRFNLAHRKYADLAAGYEVFSMEIVGHHGLEKDRAQGKVLFEPEQLYLTKLQEAFNEFLIGLRELSWRREPRFTSTG